MVTTKQSRKGAVALLVGGVAALILLSGCTLRIDHHHYVHFDRSDDETVTFLEFAAPTSRPLNMGDKDAEVP